jgi:hypothetical protein
VEEGYLLLRRLRDLKYLLAMRRGIRKRSGAVTPSDENRILRAKGRTYFFDIKKTQKGKPYLVITENRKKENKRGSDDRECLKQGDGLYV